MVQDNIKLEKRRGVVILAPLLNLFIIIHATSYHLFE